LLQVQHYIFVVQAQDSGRPSLSSTLTVYFNVVDLNDNAPLFDPMSYSNEVFENVTVGTSVVTVSATDLDSGSSSLTSKSQVTFIIMSPLGTSVTFGPFYQPRMMDDDECRAVGGRTRETEVL
jgi:protocadherin Fat 4